MAPGLVAVFLGASTAGVVLLSVGVAALAVAFVLSVAEGRAKAREDALSREHEEAEQMAVQEAREARRLALLRTTIPRTRERVPRMSDLSPYELGVAREAVDVTPRGDGEYVPRDHDSKLRAALVAAIAAGDPAMIVLRGPSKAGKSRTLVETVRSIDELRHAHVLVPYDSESVAELTAEEWPELTNPVIVWLDDLERYVSAGRRGFQQQSLDTLAGWPQRVIVVATAGGKGSEELATTSQLWVPIQVLYSDPRLRVVPLPIQLTPREQDRVRSRFTEEVAQGLITHGIGEYLVAGRELARKLQEERHKPGEPPCPEGAAVVWAAIDWSRAGMTAPIAEPMLRTLWTYYLRALQPTDQRFSDGLDWALLPLHQSIALLEDNGGYSAYDWIVAHVEAHADREIDAGAWDHILSTAEPNVAFDLGVAAYSRDESRSARAFYRAEESADPLVAAEAAFNLAAMLQRQNDIDGARAAYERAIRTGHPDLAPKSAFNLAGLLQRHGDVDGAQRALQRAIDSEHYSVAAFAAVRLGELLDDSDFEGARTAYERAIRFRHPTMTPTAGLRLGILLERHGDLAGSSNAYQGTVESDFSLAAGEAAYRLGRLLEEDGNVAGARAAYERAIEIGESNFAPLFRAQPWLSSFRPRGHRGCSSGLRARGQIRERRDRLSRGV